MDSTTPPSTFISTSTSAGVSVGVSVGASVAPTSPAVASESPDWADVDGFIWIEEHPADGGDDFNKLIDDSGDYEMKTKGRLFKFGFHNKKSEGKVDGEEESGGRGEEICNILILMFKCFFLNYGSFV